MASKLDLLMEIAAEENRLVKYPVQISGRDFTYWAKPTTIADFQAAKRACKDKEDLLEQSVRLFVRRALDENGTPQYGTDAVPALIRVLDMTKVTALLNAEPEEDLSVGKLDMKSASAAAKK